MDKMKDIPRLAFTKDTFFVDTHCHLDMAEFNGEEDTLIARAREVGVVQMITIGTDLASSYQAVEMACRQEEIFAAIGVCPHSVDEMADKDYDNLAALARRPKVVAYGEIGLDYVKLLSKPERQRQHFERQAFLAKDLGLPLIIHDRQAHDDVLAILKKVGHLPARGVMHCFSGDVRFAHEVIELGFLISIPGVVTFSNAAMLHEVVRMLPLSALLLETDAPYLAPMPRRGKRNEPAYLVWTAMKVAALKGVPLPEVARITTANARILFGLPDV